MPVRPGNLLELAPAEQSGHTLLNKNMKKEDLRIAAGLTTNMIANMGKNKGISMETLEKICDALQCEITDVIELTEDPQKENV